jgi:superoxide dismutase, Cu-Zn family
MVLRSTRTVGASLLLITCGLQATTPGAETTVNIVSADGIGDAVGTVRFSDTTHGLMIVPDLRGLNAGPLAAHIHENPDCSSSTDGVPAGAAGGHFDPSGSGEHAGPYGNGHLGDLPNLIVENDGTATIPVVAPRVRVADIHGRALMIHAGADRYAGHSKHQHGTGGDRMYCGVID